MYHVAICTLIKINFQYVVNLNKLCIAILNYLTIGCFLTEPEIPRNLTVVNSTYTTVTLSWLPPSEPNGIIIRYDLEYIKPGDILFTRLFPFNNTDLTRTITGLSPGTTYLIRVAAVTVVGRGPYAGNVTEITGCKFTVMLGS